MSSETWEQLYMLAAMEVDGRKMPERIIAVRETIRARLDDLLGSGHYEERQHLKNTLEKLDALEAEAREWKPVIREA